MVWFQNVTFLRAFQVMSADTGYGLFGILTAIVMMGFLHDQTAMRSFGLITSVPERVTSWFGQAGDRLGEDHDTKTLAGALVTRTEGAASRFGAMGMAKSLAPGGAGNVSKVTGNMENQATGPGATAGSATTNKTFKGGTN